VALHQAVKKSQLTVHHLDLSHRGGENDRSSSGVSGGKSSGGEKDRSSSGASSGS